MASRDDSRPKSPNTSEEDDLSASSLQLKLAANIVDHLAERNGGRDLADAFWDDDTFDSLDGEGEYLDPKLWDPDEETLPEMDDINWNIYECN